MKFKFWQREKPYRLQIAPEAEEGLLELCEQEGMTRAEAIKYITDAISRDIGQKVVNE